MSEDETADLRVAVRMNVAPGTGGLVCLWQPGPGTPSEEVRRSLTHYKDNTTHANVDSF